MQWSAARVIFPVNRWPRRIIILLYGIVTIPAHPKIPKIGNQRDYTLGDDAMKRPRSVMSIGVGHFAAMQFKIPCGRPPPGGNKAPGLGLPKKMNHFEPLFARAGEEQSPARSRFPYSTVLALKGVL